MDVLLRVLPFFLLIAVGVVAGRAKAIDLAGARALSAYVFWIAFPALLVHALSHAPAPDGHIAASLVTYFVASAVVPVSLTLLIGRLLGWNKEARAGAGMASIVGNTAFLGVPLVIALLGAQAAAPAAAVISIDTTLSMVIATITLRGAAGDGSARKIALLTATHPLVIGSVIGTVMAFAGVVAPGPIDQVLATLSATASPVGLVALGVVVGLEFAHGSRADAAPVAVSALVKTLVAPVLVWLALGLIGADPLFRAVATLLAACPTAVNVFIQTRTLGVFAKGGAMTVVIATLIAAVTLPLLGLLLTR